jgi:two-component system, NtrC family, response regulator HydG
MRPTLVFRCGPRRGEEVTLDESELSIGRDKSNRLPVFDPALSRHHCQVCVRGEVYTIRDLDSRNGTFVNGVPIKERTLRDGDLIALGESVVMLFVRRREPVTTLSPEEEEDAAIISELTIELRPEDARYPPAGMTATAPPAQSRAEADLSALLRISTALGALRDRESLQRTLVERLLEVIPADAGAVALGDGDRERFSSIVGRDRKGKPFATVSRTIARRVISTGVSILSPSAQEDKRFEMAKSVAVSRIRSTLCAPLTVGNRTLGVLYFSTSNPATIFDEDHLQLVMAAAGVGAVALDNLAHVEWLQEEAIRLRGEIRLAHDLVGESERMREVYERIAKVAPTESTVLIRGESGTGKELTAHALHVNSPRASGPFVSINCAALTESLLESELFGHEKGAFTGAVAQKRGRLEVADHGTVFLDEIGELALPLQAKLLRVLQEREFERVGGTRSIKVDVRLIAATNRNLETAVKSGTFRQDLYYRLNVVSLTMPPLRDRVEDIPLLATYFVRKHAARCKRKVAGISAEARHRLMRYHWPGNVRELENAIERAIVLGSCDRIMVEDLPETLVEGADQPGLASTKYHDAINQFKRDIILKAIDQAEGNYTAAARLLGLHPNYLFRLIRSMRLKAADPA